MKNRNDALLNGLSIPALGNFLPQKCVSILGGGSSIRIGLYGLKRNSDETKIGYPFIFEIRVRKGKEFSVSAEDYIYVKGKNNWKYRAFEFEYNLKDNEIEGFDVSKSFAEKTNIEEFRKFLNNSIPFILQKGLFADEKSDKREREFIRQMKNTPIQFNQIQNEEHRGKTRLNTQLTTLHSFNSKTYYLIQQINMRAEKINNSNQKFDLIEFHNIENLINNRLPIFLNSYKKLESNLSLEKRKSVEEILKNTLLKLEALLESKTNDNVFDFQKEEMLIKSILK